jgi:hypothetical protein
MGTEDPTTRDESTEGEGETPDPKPVDWNRDDVIVLEDDGDY